MYPVEMPFCSNLATHALRALLGPPARSPGLALWPALFLAACASVPRDIPPDLSPGLPHAVPTWVGQGASWEKLDAIESWLANGPGPGFWSVEGRLLLAEGWLTFSRDDHNRDRLLRAHTQFTRVLSAPSRSATQTARASAGLATCRDLLIGGSAPGFMGLAGLDIIRRSSWGAAAPVAARLTRGSTSYSRITVHHAGEGPGTTLSPRGSRSATADALRRIQSFHVKERGWGDVGYHFLIDPAGRIYEGRSLAFQGAHAGGDNNVGNIGVCLPGNFQNLRPPPVATAALRRLLDRLRAQHTIPRTRVYPHDRFTTTDCPGRRLKTWLRSY